MAPNLGEMPPTPEGISVWPSNSHRGYNKRLPRVIVESEWTDWFNLHSRHYMEGAYPSSLAWHMAQDGSKPFYTQRFWPDIPGSVEFPRVRIQQHFATPKGPNRYFTCSIAWLLAFAIIEGFERIELWGFQLSDKKSGNRWLVERPNFFYWVKQARDLGIDVWYQPEIEQLPFVIGDPDTYDGPLYGYSTKSEPDWDPVAEDFRS
jgi:hypothetical protein